MAVASDSGWLSSLPLVLLGLRSTWRPDLDASPADLVLGEPLRLPGDLVVPSSTELSSDFVADLRTRMASLRPAQTSHHRSASNAPKDDPLRIFRGLDFAYVRIDATKPPLVRPYAGPFEIVEKNPKYFVILRKGKQEKVSVDRLKPAFGNLRSSQTFSSAKPNSITERLFKLANYPCKNQFSTNEKPPLTVSLDDEEATPTVPLDDEEETPPALSYRDALLTAPTANSPVITRSGRVSVPVSRYSP